MHSHPPQDVDPVLHSLVRQKARQLVGKAGFTHQDVEDLCQELLAEVYHRFSSFDPAEITLEGFYVLVINHAISNLIRKRSTQKRDYRRSQTVAEIPEPATSRRQLSERQEQRPEPDHRAQQEQMDLMLDLREAMELMSKDLQLITHVLKKHNVSEAARALNIPRTTLLSRMRKIRRHLEDARLQEYLDDFPSPPSTDSDATG